MEKKSEVFAKIFNQQMILRYKQHHHTELTNESFDEIYLLAWKEWRSLSDAEGKELLREVFDKTLNVLEQKKSITELTLGK